MSDYASVSPLRNPKPDAVAVIGTGSIGMRHLRILRDLGASPIAVPVRAERVVELRHHGYTAVDLASLVGYGRVFSIVATNTARHLDDASQLAVLGDVLIEKPIAASMRGLRELNALAAEHGSSIYCAYCLRQHPGIRAFRRQLPRIGEVHSVRIESQSHLPDWRSDRDHRRSYSARVSEGGVIRDLSHELDYAVWIFGRPIRVHCVAGNLGRLDIASEEFADLLWRTPDQAAISVRLDYLTRPSRRQMYAYGERGSLSWDGVTGTLTLQLVGEAPETLAIQPELDSAYSAQAVSFLKGDPDGILATLDEGAFIVSLIEAAKRSAQSGRFEEVEEWNEA